MKTGSPKRLIEMAQSLNLKFKKSVFSQNSDNFEYELDESEFDISYFDRRFVDVLYDKIVFKIGQELSIDEYIGRQDRLASQIFESFKKSKALRKKMKNKAVNA